MKLKIALCDDDRTALPVIAGAVESAFRNREIRTEIRCFQTGKELLEALTTTRFDLILLDIDLPEMDGIQVALRIREMGQNAPLVFVSECENRVFEAFETQPMTFVRKSNFLNDLATMVRLYMKFRVQDKNDEYVEFETRKGLMNLKIRDIHYIEGDRNYQLLHMEGTAEPIQVKLTMDKLEEALESRGFIRIHKGYMVNCRFIQRIQNTTLSLRDGVELPIGRSKMGEVKSKFLLHMGK